MFRLLKICSILLVCSIYLFGCDHISKRLDPSFDAPQIVLKPELQSVTKNKREKITLEIKANDRPDEFIKALYEARLNLAFFDRAKAQSALQRAFDEAQKLNINNDYTLRLLQVDFSKEGFAKTTSYLVLQKEPQEQINYIITNLALNNQELSSISIVKPNNPVISDAIMAYIETALSAIKNINPEAPDYDFNIADKKIRRTYESWKARPSKEDIEFETTYYLGVAESLLDKQKYDAARVLLGKAKEKHREFSAQKNKKEKDYELISFYKSKLSSIEKRLKSSKNGVIDYLF